MASPTEVSFGNTEGFPDVTALERIDWRANRLPNAGAIYSLPDFPDQVVRLHYGIRSTATPDQLSQDLVHLAQLGSRHFGILSDLGIDVPAQKSVIGPDFLRMSGRRDTPTLYTFTQRLTGRPLERSIADARYAPAIVDSLTEYLKHSCEKTPDSPDFLYDIMKAHQHTLLATGRTVLHDTDLSFASHTDRNGTLLFRLAIHDLMKWVGVTEIDPPGDLVRLYARTVEM